MITTAGDLKADYCIHAVGPHYARELSERKSLSQCDRLLADAYRAAMACAEQMKVETVAFSLLSAGSYREPQSLENVLLECIRGIRMGMYKELRELYVMAHTDEEKTTLEKLCDVHLPGMPRHEESQPSGSGLSQDFSNLRLQSGEEDNRGFTEQDANAVMQTCFPSLDTHASMQQPDTAGEESQGPPDSMAKLHGEGISHPPGLETRSTGRNSAQDGEITCGVCLLTVDSTEDDIYRSVCGHTFHDNCMTRWHSTCRTGPVTCPLCRRQLSDGDGIFSLSGGANDPPPFIGDEQSDTSDADMESSITLESTHPHQRGRDDVETLNLNDETQDRDALLGEGHEPADDSLLLNPIRLDIQIPRCGPSDPGIPASMPPPESFATIVREVGPCLVAYAEVGPGPYAAPFFQGQCPWIQ